MTRLTRTLAALATAVTLAAPAAAQDEAVSLVPANAVTVGMVRLADIRISPLASFLFEHVDSLSTDGEAEAFLLEAGLRPVQDVDTIVVATSPRTTFGSEPDILVVAVGRFEPGRLAGALVARGGVDKGRYIALPEPSDAGAGEAGAVAFLSTRLAIAGNERSVRNALAARAAGGTDFVGRGALAMVLGRVDPRASAWALIDVARAARLADVGEIDAGAGPSGAALRAAVTSVSTVVAWARDTGDALELGATGLANDAETLQLLEDAIRGALAAMRLAVSETEPGMLPVLRGFDVDQQADSITVRGSIPAEMLRNLMTKKLAAASKPD